MTSFDPVTNTVQFLWSWTSLSWCMMHDAWCVSFSWGWFWFGYSDSKTPTYWLLYFQSSHYSVLMSFENHFLTLTLFEGAIRSQIPPNCFTLDLSKSFFFSKSLIGFKASHCIGGVELDQPGSRSLKRTFSDCSAIHRGQVLTAGETTLQSELCRHDWEVLLSSLC